MPKLTLTERETRDIVYGDHKDWEIVKDKIIEQARWSSLHLIIAKHKPTGKLYESVCNVGSTEMQDQDSYEEDEPIFIEVEPYEVTITKYRQVKDKDGQTS